MFVIDTLSTATDLSHHGTIRSAGPEIAKTGEALIIAAARTALHGLSVTTGRWTHGYGWSRGCPASGVGSDAGTTVAGVGVAVVVRAAFTSVTNFSRYRTVGGAYSLEANGRVAFPAVVASAALANGAVNLARYVRSLLGRGDAATNAGLVHATVRITMRVLPASSVGADLSTDRTISGANTICAHAGKAFSTVGASATASNVLRKSSA